MSATRTGSPRARGFRAPATRHTAAEQQAAADANFAEAEATARAWEIVRLSKSGHIGDCGAFHGRACNCGLDAGLAAIAKAEGK